MTFFTRADRDDRHEGAPLTRTDCVTPWEAVPDAGMDAIDVAIEEMGQNGGFIFNEHGDWCKFVAPTPK